MAFNIVIQNIEQYANLAAFPAAGNSNILYIDEATSTAYFWDGAAYSSVSGGSGGSVDRADLIGLNQITDGIITPAQLNSDQDDYSPTGFSTCNLIRQDINGDRVITGFVAPAAGVNRIFCIANLSGSNNIKFKNTAKRNQPYVIPSANLSCCINFLRIFRLLENPFIALRDML